MKRLKVFACGCTIIAMVMSISILYGGPMNNDALPRVGPAAVGAAVSIGIAIAKEIIAAIQAEGVAAVYVKAKTDGPDGDDAAVGVNWDHDHGWDWHLKAETGWVHAGNDYHDTDPFYPNPWHQASIGLAFESTDGQWVPERVFDVFGRMQEVYGYAFARPDDDPVGANDETYAAAVGVFSSDGKTIDFTYGADVQTEPGGGVVLEWVRKIPPPKLAVSSPASAVFDESPPQFFLVLGDAFLASVARFDFKSLSGDRVLITPKWGPIIDLFHCYLHMDDNPHILPTVRGHDGLAAGMLGDAYENEDAETVWTVSEDPNEIADLTVVGAAIELKNLIVSRNDRSNYELLKEYFSSDSVKIVAPEHAQAGYVPEVTLRSQVKSGQDISDLVGRDFMIPKYGPPEDEYEEDSLVGLFVSISGGLDQAVELAANTENHPIRDIVLAAWDGSSDQVQFSLSELNYHCEIPSSISDISVNSAGPMLGIDPDTMYYLYTQAIYPMSASIYIGNLPAGHTAADIDTTSIAINGAITPTVCDLIPDVPGFTGSVLKVDFLMKEFIEGYGLLWDTVVSPYYVTGVYLDDSPFTFADSVTFIGHRSGDINGDGLVNIGDPVYLIGYIFRDGPPPPYLEMGNVNGDEQVNIGDAVYMISFLFRSGPPPVPHEGE